MVIILRPEDLVPEASGSWVINKCIPLEEITLDHVTSSSMCPQMEDPSTIILVMRHDEPNMKVLKNYMNRPFPGNGVYRRSSANLHALCTFGVVPGEFPIDPAEYPATEQEASQS